MKPKKQRVSRRYAHGSTSILIAQAEAVSANMYDKDAFADPPVTKLHLDAAIQAVLDAIGAMGQGGTAATAEKNNRVAELIAILDLLAGFVQTASNNDLAILLSSGFKAVSTNRTREMLATPGIKKTKNGATGQSLTTVTAVRNSRGYELQYALIDEAGAPGVWMDALFSTSSLNIPAVGLIPGRVYAYRVRAMGGLTGQSNWSELTTHRAN